MATATARKRIPKTKIKSRKQKIRDYVSRFKVKFNVENDAIDLRAMSENYDADSGIIPLEDIHRIIRIAIGDEGNTQHNIDPSGGINISYPPTVTGPRLGYIDWDEAFLWPRFQRDVAPNHINKIRNVFDPSCVLVPNAIKVTVNGKVHYCIWDGHHTMQVCRLEGYKRFPVWYVDIDTVPDAVIKAAGFDPVTERIEYGVNIAGRNMIMINSTNKRPLANYDKFMIQLETRDRTALAMNEILKKNKCVPRRSGDCAGALTQFKNAEDCFALVDQYGNNEGIFWDRALRFHRKTWAKAPLELEIFRPLSLLYHKAFNDGKPLDAQFDKEFAALLVKTYGDPDEVQLQIKESYENAVENNLMQGNSDYLKTHPEQVLAGMINLYNQQIGRTRLPFPKAKWTV